MTPLPETPPLKLKKGDTFQMPVSLPIGKDGRNVKHVCQCLVIAARQKGVSYQFTFEGRRTDKTPVRVEGRRTITYTRLEKVIVKDN